MKLIFLIFGFLSLGLGVIGIFLPVLPTTPFILLSAYLFGRSSERFHRYLRNHRVFGPTIRDFNERKVLSRRTKVYALSMMWVVMLSSVIFFMPYWWARAVLLLIGAGVTLYLIRYPEPRK
jgi:uncharacterized membrane protein YbaN (DUF454 family)